MSNGDRKRRKWGCVVACKDADGRIVSWQARYQSPVNPRQRIYRRFGLEFQTEAYRWLDEEHALSSSTIKRESAGGRIRRRG